MSVAAHSDLSSFFSPSPELCGSILDAIQAGPAGHWRPLRGLVASVVYPRQARLPLLRAVSDQVRTNVWRYLGTIAQRASIGEKSIFPLDDFRKTLIVGLRERTGLPRDVLKAIASEVINWLSAHGDGYRAPWGELKASPGEVRFRVRPAFSPEQRSQL